MSDSKETCNCMVCRNRRHRETVCARHNAGMDYPGIRDRIMERVNEPVDPNWRGPKPEPSKGEGEK